jgi:hypothetical protein
LGWLDGAYLPVSVIAARTGLLPDTIRHRIQHGIPLDKPLRAPVPRRKWSESIKDLALQTGLHPSTVRYRLQHGLSLAKPTQRHRAPKKRG